MVERELNSESDSAADTTKIAPKDRFLGCLLGLAIGDALGMPVEGWSREEIAARHGWIDGYLPRLDDEGQVQVPAGEFTDDTEVMLCHVESLISSGGYVDPEAVEMRLLRLARSDSRRFLDPTTLAAIERMESDTDAGFQAGAATDGPAGNAIAPALVPIGLMHALGRLNPEIFTREVLRAGCITHSRPESLNGALAMAYAVWLLAGERIPAELLIEEVASFIDEDEVAQRLRLAGSLVPPGGEIDRDQMMASLAEIGTSCDVAESVGAAFYCFAAAKGELEVATLLAANAGGDTDTIAAMAGALAGTYQGARAIPARLVDGLEGRMYILVAAPGLYRAAQRRAGTFIQLHLGGAEHGNL